MIEEIARNILHIPIIMAMVLLYGLLLNVALFRPIRRVMDERKRRIREAGDLSSQSRDQLKSRFREYELAVLEAHRKGTHIKEEARVEANAYRSKLLAEVKAEAAARLRSAEQEMALSVEGVRRDLQSWAPRLAGQMASKVLGREVAV